MKCTKKNVMGMSLSQWSPQSLLLHPAHHGEKFSTTNTNLESFPNLFGSNLSMEKQFLELDVDPATLLCVDPYEVNPIMVEKTMLPSTLSVDIPLKGNVSYTRRNSSLPYGGGFYGPQRKIKLEMEEFRDLSSFLPKPMSTNSVDELNTPIFDKDAFDFNVNISQKDSQSEESFIKLESDAYYGTTRKITDNSPFKNFSLNTEKVQRNENITSEVDYLQNSDINQYSPQSENISAYTCTILPSYDNANSNVYIVDDKSALSVNSRQVSDAPSANKELWQDHIILETPEDSNSSTSTDRQSKLSLDINLKALNHENLDTPTIIQEVVDFESSNFNILDLVANEEISYVSSEDIFITPSSVSSVTESNEAVAETREYIPHKKPRKRRTCSDDDEDYVPPSKKNVLQRRNVIRKASESESESDIEIERTPKSRPRGRPPKRTASISSDCSKDSDVSKYRELRDKNNEASRKSRLKRKIKEIGLEKEADELICRNIKLKAQVEELEKMVNNFRDNLFKLMIKK